MDENGYDNIRRDRSPIRDDNSDFDDSKRRLDRGRGGSGGRRNEGGRSRRAPADRRVYVSNIAYEVKWQDIKDLFVKEVGDVSYVNLFSDDKGKSRGCGVIEFGDEDLAKLAIDKMNKYSLSGREIVVKEDTDKERDRHGYIVKDGGRGMKTERSHNMSDNRDDPSKFGNTYGLNVSFLESLGINGRLVCRVFVANLDYKVDEKKLKEVFRLAGKILSCDLQTDKDGHSRGYASIEYEHPVEAVQAISMFKDQMLFERKMVVRMDSAAMREDKDGIPTKLPNGLKGIGMGLGSAGAPLKNVLNNMGSSGGSGVGGGAGTGNINRNTVASLAAASGLGAGLGNFGLTGGLGALGAAGLSAQLGAAGLGAGLGSLGGGGLGLGFQGGLGGNFNDSLRGDHSRDDSRRRTWD